MLVSGGGVFFSYLWRKKIVIIPPRVMWFHWKWITEGEHFLRNSIIFSLYPLQKLTNVTLKINGFRRHLVADGCHLCIGQRLDEQGDFRNLFFRGFPGLGGGNGFFQNIHQPQEDRNKCQQEMAGLLISISSPKKDSKQKGAKHPMFLFTRPKRWIFFRPFSVRILALLLTWHPLRPGYAATLAM